MKRAKLSPVIGLALVALLMVAGCAAPAPVPAPAVALAAPAPTQPPAPAAAPTAAPTAAAGTGKAATSTASDTTLRMATTTSTADSGLLDYLLPAFEKANNVKVDVVAVGTGQAIAIGQKCDADVLLVHARSQEDKFVADGYAKKRDDVMYNDFIIMGPKADPAKVATAANAPAAFKAIADAKQTFVSRGDKSGTNTKELSIWSSARITPTKEMNWYNAIGQGMGDTLVFANEKQGYTLADRGTYLSMKDKLPNFAVVFGGDKLADNKDKTLLNPYGVLAVNPDKCPNVISDLAQKFVTWILSPETQKMIDAYGVDKYGQQLFYANAKK